MPCEDSFLKYVCNGLLNMPPHHISRFSDTALRRLAEILGITLVALHHEEVQPEHAEYYKQAMWLKKILPYRLVDLGLYRRIISKSGRIARKFMKIPKDARGHTVIAVYKV